LPGREQNTPDAPWRWRAETVRSFFLEKGAEVPPGLWSWRMVPFVARVLPDAAAPARYANYSTTSSTAFVTLYLSTLTAPSSWSTPWIVIVARLREAAAARERPGRAWRRVSKLAVAAGDALRGSRSYLLLSTHWIPKS
jgi:hypothetical protein